MCVTGVCVTCIAPGLSRTACGSRCSNKVVRDWETSCQPKWDNLNWDKVQVVDFNWDQLKWYKWKVVDLDWDKQVVQVRNWDQVVEMVVQVLNWDLVVQVLKWDKVVVQ